MPDDPSLPCDAACQKIIIDGRIMQARTRYLINILDIQDDKAAHLLKVVTREEKKKLLDNSQKQCDFSKLIEASANETAYLISEIEKRAAGIDDRE